MIKNVIIIDDDRYKRERIAGYIRKILPEAEIHEYACVRDGHVAVRRGYVSDIKANPTEWLVITDMVMPRFSDGRDMVRDGGRRILYAMAWDKLECPAIVASSEEVNSVDLSSVYKHYIGSVREEYNVYCKPYYEALIKKIMV